MVSTSSGGRVSEPTLKLSVCIVELDHVGGCFGMRPKFVSRTSSKTQRNCVTRNLFDSHNPHPRAELFSSNKTNGSINGFAHRGGTQTKILPVLPCGFIRAICNLELIVVDCVMLNGSELYKTFNSTPLSTTICIHGKDSNFDGGDGAARTVAEIAAETLRDLGHKSR